MKKFILRGIFISVIILFVNFLTPPPIFAFLGDNNSQSDGEFDCSAAVSEAVNPASAWKNAGEVMAEKRTLKRKENDYCLLKHTSHVSDYGAGIGDVEDPVIMWSVKVRYFAKKFTPDTTFALINRLKQTEKANFKMMTDQITSYYGNTEDLTGPNYARSVQTYENCLIEQTLENDLSPVIKGDGIFSWSKTDVNGHMGMMGQWMSSLQYDLSAHQNLTNFCSRKDFIPANLIPEETSGSSESESSQQDSGQQAKQNKPGKDGNPLSIFGFNPLETWRNIQGLLDIPAGLNSLVQTAEILSGPTEIKIQVPEPVISLDPEGKRWDFLPGFIPHESIKPGSTITATKPTTFQTGSAVIQLRPNNNQEGSMQIGTHPFLQSGEAEIIVEPQNGQQFELQTPNAEIFVIGTKFLAAYNPKKDQTLVAVYEGKVEVKTKDGQTTTVTPNDDKQGVVVVRQKLSVIKLALVVLVLALIIGGVSLFLKRKIISKKFNKKRK